LLSELPYRSLEFRHVNLTQEQFQPVGTVNYPNDYGYARISEFKHITGQESASTSIVCGYLQAEGDRTTRCHPVPRPENAALYKRCEADAEQLTNVTFVGRLATYEYYNLDQVVGQALTAFKRLQRRLGERTPRRLDVAA
jgi:UDP-galactopyranose mutase